MRCCDAVDPEDEYDRDATPHERRLAIRACLRAFPWSKVDRVVSNGACHRLVTLRVEDEEDNLVMAQEYADAETLRRMENALRETKFQLS